MPQIADVLIQAGHEGRTTGATGATGPLGDEIDWTPIVADEATKVMRNAGLSVIRANAFLGPSANAYHVDLALFIHFDGDDPPCNSGASIGYNDTSDKPAADAWRALYGKYWPFKWMDDNFTANLRSYYGFKYAKTSDAELVLELGEIGCMVQAQWLKPRLKWLGQLIAHFASVRLGKGNISAPAILQPGMQPLSATLAGGATVTGIESLYAGLTSGDFDIPRKGLKNHTLWKVSGQDIEQYGNVVVHRGLKFVEGRCSWFGGPDDTGVTPTEVMTLTGENARQIDPNDFYCAMRWNYRNNKSFWRNRPILLINPLTGTSVVARAVDWGPNLKTRRTVDISPGAMTALGLDTDDLILVAFAQQAAIATAMSKPSPAAARQPRARKTPAKAAKSAKLIVPAKARAGAKVKAGAKSKAGTKAGRKRRK